MTEKEKGLIVTKKKNTYLIYIYTQRHTHTYMYILPDFSGAHILGRQLQSLELYMYLTKTGETVKNEKAY